MEKDLKKLICETVEAKLNELIAVKKYLYDNPEIGGTEEKSSAYLIERAKENGFKVESPVLDIPYSYRAEFDSGKPGPTIGLTQEYDALPSIGHGCGHNFIAATSLGAAIALREVVKETGGRVILYGTPAEENLVPKCEMAAKGVFDELDIAMMVHPNAGDGGASGPTTALDAWQVEFYGKSSHAGAAPEKGINALDAAVHFYSLVGFEKQYLPNTNIYGVFVDAGEKCSVIPDHASVKYLVRAPKVRDIKKIRELFEHCAEAVCLIKGTSYKIWNNEPGNMNMETNETLSGAFNSAYEELSGIKLRREKTGGSTDMGDVSHVVPAIHPWPGIGGGTEIHTVDFREACMTELANERMKYCAEALALTGARVLTEPALLAAIKAEFEEAKKDF